MNGLMILLLLFAVLVMIGMFLSLASRDSKRSLNKEESMIDSVNSLLPQTQCAQCGYPGCEPYARAIVEQNEAINRCPPGGDSTIEALASYLGTKVIPLNEDCGEIKPALVAVIDEPACIGCTLCIQACPVDAIVGAQKLMHTVIESDCTGCELCLPPCPVDCIDLIEPRQSLSSWQWPKPA